MKKKLVLLFIIYLFNLLGCSHSSGSTHLVSHLSIPSTATPKDTVVMALNLLQEKNTAKYHELTDFQMATDYKASYIATDPFASSPFENFLTLQYMSSIINQSTYEIIEVQQESKEASVTVKLNIPNYTMVLEQSLPQIIKSYRQHYSSNDYQTFEQQKSLLMIINEMIIDSCQDSNPTEIVNTFKLKYIDNDWYIVDNGIIYHDIANLVQFYSRQI